MAILWNMYQKMKNDWQIRLKDCIEKVRIMGQRLC